MKKFLFLVLPLLLLGFAPRAAAQQYIQSQTLTNTAVATNYGPLFENSNVLVHVLTWTTTPGTGTVSACTIQIQSAPDGVTWTNLANAQSCTATGNSSYAASGAFTYIRVITTAATLTGNATVQFNYYGYTAQQATSDNFYNVPPGACSWNQSGGTLVSNGLANVGTSFAVVNQISTTSTTLTAVLTCDIAPPSRVTGGKGIVISNAILEYGPSTGTLQSMALPTAGIIIMPAPGTSETPSTVAPVATGGTITTTPAVASANLTALTAGAFYSENITFGTPIVFSSSTGTPGKLQLSQSFVGASAASEILYSGDIVVYYISIPQ